MEHKYYEIQVKGKSFFVLKKFIYESVVLRNLTKDTMDDSSIIPLDDNFDIEALMKIYTFYLKIKDLKVGDLNFLHYIKYNFGDLKEKYSRRNKQIPHHEVFEEYSKSEEFMSYYKRMIKVCDFLDMYSIQRMMAPILSIVIIDLPRDEKIQVFKCIRGILGHIKTED